LSSGIRTAFLALVVATLVVILFLALAAPAVQPA